MPLLDLDYSLEGILGAGIATIAGVYLVVVLLMLAACVLVYVFHAMGLYTIARRRGIHHPWLAWIPIGEDWLLGSISDHYQYMAKGQIRSRRKILLGVNIAIAALSVFTFVFSIAFFVASIAAISQSSGTGSVVGLTAASILTSLVITVLGIVSAVYQYICYYDLFASCNPENKVLYLVLGILFGFTLPFFVFDCRNKDFGMPANEKKTQSAPAVPEATVTVEPARGTVEPEPEAAPAAEAPVATAEPAAEAPAVTAEQSEQGTAEPEEPRNT